MSLENTQPKYKRNQKGNDGIPTIYVQELY